MNVSVIDAVHTKIRTHTHTSMSDNILNIFIFVLFLAHNTYRVTHTHTQYYVQIMIANIFLFDLIVVLLGNNRHILENICYIAYDICHIASYVNVTLVVTLILFNHQNQKK